jgi:glucose/arabinose dehydrogenase
MGLRPAQQALETGRWMRHVRPVRGFKGLALGALVILLVGFVVIRGLRKQPERTPMPKFLGLPAQLELDAGSWALKPVFAHLTFDDPVLLVQAPLTNTFFILEREGRIFAFDNDEKVSTKTLALNLWDVTQGELDSGLLGLVFHPEFGKAGSPNRNYAYVHYAYTPDPVHGQWPPRDKLTRSRLSRFNVDLKTWAFDPASELVLIDQEDESVYHQGGSMFFHPKDGFLYLSVGDEGSSACRLDNCQRIDKDLFSGVLRIDVDERGGAVSHPIPRQPQTGKTAHYFIPNDNPFVGQPGVLEEFYALGLRSPHRMTYDLADNITWIADVGQKSREELDILKPAANYQWNIREGMEPRKGGQTPDNPIGVWTDPVLDMERDEAASIIGGHVYRGRLQPSLVGQYIYGDFVTGNVWALHYQYDGRDVKVLENELLVRSKFRNRKNGITSFGIDASGEVYVLTLGKRAKVLRLVSSTPSTNAPKLLSQLGFIDPRRGKPSQDLLPYDVQSPLWSDGAVKQRWMSLPSGNVHFDPTAAWRFPEGTVFVKKFSMALDERKPKKLRPLETRFFVAGAGGEYYGLTYKWNEEGSDAEVVLQRTEEELEIRGLDGEVRNQVYVYPGPYDCMVCHNDEAGSVLGVRTEQINHPVPGVKRWFWDNELVSWSEQGVFDVKIDEPSAETYASLVPLSRESSSVQDRLRSYWSSNCSMCHGSGPDIRANWDARWSTPFAAQGILNGPLENGERLDGERVVVPGDPEKSAMFTRSASSVPSLRMPPLGRRQIDTAYTSLLERWILSLPAARAQAK